MHLLDMLLLIALILSTLIGSMIGGIRTLSTILSLLIATLTTQYTASILFPFLQSTLGTWALLVHILIFITLFATITLTISYGLLALERYHGTETPQNLSPLQRGLGAFLGLITGTMSSGFLLLLTTSYELICATTLRGCFPSITWTATHAKQGLLTTFLMQTTETLLRIFL